MTFFFSKFCGLPVSVRVDQHFWPALQNPGGLVPLVAIDTDVYLLLTTATACWVSHRLPVLLVHEKRIDADMGPLVSNIKCPLQAC